MTTPASFLSALRSRDALIGLLWGLAEGTVFFLVPDVWISRVALRHPSRTAGVILATLIGSLLAGALFYPLAVANAAMMKELVNAVPFVTDAMFPKVAGDFEAYGIWAAVMGPLDGTPYKIYAVLAPEYAAYLAFLLTTIPARLGRYLLIALPFALVGVYGRRYFIRWPWLATAIHLAVWVGVYAIYWSAIGEI